MAVKIFAAQMIGCKNYAHKRKYKKCQQILFVHNAIVLIYLVFGKDWYCVIPQRQTMYYILIIAVRYDK
jgi:hypothetical protein